MGLPDPDVQPDTDWRWVAHAAWNHAQLALNRVSLLEERVEALESFLSGS